MSRMENFGATQYMYVYEQKCAAFIYNNGNMFIGLRYIFFFLPVAYKTAH